ncbi:MAG: isoprenylcysteine carboxylmethyltransferase family protein [Candidatus Aminicenantes bacterium]|nr:isoprenylcysteine carboxylmethyltransferase family protein [Candidatus Aminicenantes bacterium]
MSLTTVAALHFGLPLGRMIPSPWNLAGLLPLLSGVLLNLSADRGFQRAAITVKPFEKSKVLLTQGVFRISRNPMYLGFILVMLGTLLLLGSTFPWLVLPPFFMILAVRYVRREEEMLAAIFGPQWQAYKKRTRRWL